MGSKVIMINDVARAFFEAPSVRNVCVLNSLKRKNLRPMLGTIRWGIYG